jgi:predicted TIM-barrel fold metal-dependent hydrolase
MPRTYECISADSHVEVAPDRWAHWIAEKYRDRAPRRVRMPGGGDAFLVEGRGLYVGGENLYSGTSPETYKMTGICWDEMPGTGPGEQRLREQDADGVDAEVLFAGVGARNMWRGIRDRRAYLAVLRGYNDFLAKEYCAVDPERLIGLAIMPETGVDDALAELDHCARLGFKGINLSGLPSGHGFPTADDDRFWAAVVEMEMPVTVHIAFDIERNPHAPAAREPLFRYPIEPQGDDRPGPDYFRRLTIYARAGAFNAVQLMLAGVFDRFPKLKVFFAETQIGWIPNFLEQMDNNYRVNCHWAQRHFGVERLARRPSEYVREHCYWGVLYNPVGIRLRHDVGIDRIMWESDFPHCESDWPRSRALIDEQLTGVPADERRKILAGNAIEFFRLDRR